MSHIRDAVSLGTNSLLCSPLWLFPPDYRLAVLSERRRRGLMQIDPEPIGDAEFS